jgi:hypothetical protein
MKRLSSEIYSNERDTNDETVQKRTTTTNAAPY